MQLRPEHGLSGERRYARGIPRFSATVIALCEVRVTFCFVKMKGIASHIAAFAETAHPPHSEGLRNTSSLAYPSAGGKSPANVV